MTRSPGRGSPPGSVRISAGRWKGRRLEVPSGARPTSARAREALLDLLADRVPSARALELFAGSGAVGLELLSRGASRCVFVERESDALERNVAKLAPAAGEVEVLPLDAARAVETLSRRPERFDVVFADPPYGLPAATEALARAGPLLSPGGIFVLQADTREGLPDRLSVFRVARRRAYGRNVFWFLELAEPPEGGDSEPVDF